MAPNQDFTDAHRKLSIIEPIGATFLYFRCLVYQRVNSQRFRPAYRLSSRKDDGLLGRSDHRPSEDRARPLPNKIDSI